MAQPADTEPRNLVQVAVDVHTDLNKLLVGLQRAGAQPEALQSIEQMAQIVGELVKVLGSGSVGGETAGAGAPPQQQAPPEQGPPPGGPPQGGPPQGPMPGARPNGFHEATAQLQSALASKHAAAQRALAAGQ